jgi:C1A family cysteine protease
MEIKEFSVILDVLPSPQDDRDYRYSQKKIELPEYLDLRENDSTIENQGSIGSCVANAIATAYELMVRKLYPDKFAELSRLFIYYNSRLFNNSIKEDSGTYIRDGLKSASRYGICSENLWPYIVDNFDKQPSPKCYVDASQRLITRYEVLYTLRDMLEIINDQRPIIVSMYIYRGFMNMDVMKSVVRMPNDSEQNIGSHAVVLVGYDLKRQLFLAQNSFGTSWGDNGYFWIPFEYIRTQAFEKWCFDISSQKNIDIDADSQISKTKKTLIGKILVKIGPEGVKLKPI